MSSLSEEISRLGGGEDLDGLEQRLIELQRRIQTMSEMESSQPRHHLDRRYVQAVEVSLAAVDICLNMVSSYEEGYGCFRKLQSTLRQFGISMKAFFAGALYNDPPRFMKALRAAHPAALFAAPNHVSDSVNSLWDHVLKSTGGKAVDSFFQKIFLGP